MLMIIGKASEFCRSRLQPVHIAHILSVIVNANSVLVFRSKWSRPDPVNLSCKSHKRNGGRKPRSQHARDQTWTEPHHFDPTKSNVSERNGLDDRTVLLQLRKRTSSRSLLLTRTRFRIGSLFHFCIGWKLADLQIYLNHMTCIKYMLFVDRNWQQICERNCGLTADRNFSGPYSFGTHRWSSHQWVVIRYKCATKCSSWAESGVFRQIDGRHTVCRRDVEIKQPCTYVADQGCRRTHTSCRFCSACGYSLNIRLMMIILLFVLLHSSVITLNESRFRAKWHYWKFIR